VNENDPSSTFRQDQEAAETEAATRDEVAWQQHVRAQEGDLALKTALHRRMVAQSKVMEAFAAVLLWAMTAAVLLGLLWAVQGIVGWFG
jgi:hypothetical protein